MKKCSLSTSFILFSFVILLTNCSAVKTQPVSAPVVSKFEIAKDTQVGCLELADNYCKSLYSADSLGNIEVIRPGGNISILQGETSNDFKQQFYSYSKAKLRGKEKLPKIFLKVLSELSYFKKLQELLSRSSRSKMTFQERVYYERLAHEIDSLWDTAFNETLLRRLTLRFPGYHKIRSREMPPEYEIEYAKERRKLNNQISYALWSEDKNWENVKDTFKHLQTSFYRIIDRMQIDQPLKDDFKNRIATIELALPGSRPEIEDDDCSSTKVNAFYYKYLNIITVCAGDFNTEDILQTMAHEMSHALDFSRSVYMYKMNTELARNQKSLRKQICETKKVDCSQWGTFKTQLPDLLARMTNYDAPLKEFNQCLQLKSVTRKATDEDYLRVARADAAEIFSSLAGDDYFLRITKDKLPLRNGKSIRNPYYLNPCKYYHWSSDEEPPEDEINSLVYFTAEYMCSEKNSEIDEKDKFKNALDVSKQLSEKVITATLKASGEFSSDPVMMGEGLSSPSNERFADVLGSYAIKDYLKNFSSIQDRRGKFLASISWLCTEPSLAARFPDESLVQSKFLSSEHTSGTIRLKEILGGPIRDSLECRKDFIDNECKLPLLGQP